MCMCIYNVLLYYSLQWLAREQKQELAGQMNHHVSQRELDGYESDLIMQSF